MSLIWKASDTLKLSLQKQDISTTQLSQPYFLSKASQISTHVGGRSGKLQLFLMYELTPQASRGRATSVIISVVPL